MVASIVIAPFISQWEPVEIFLGIICSLIFAPILYLSLLRFILTSKYIEIDDKNLHINPSNFSSSELIVIPLKEVYQAEQVSFFANPQRIAIHFMSSTQLGDKIYFIGKYRAFAFSLHPVVDEINEAVKQAKLVP
jgi:hypothetical protein